MLNSTTQVLLLGGPDCGKTTLLSSMFYQCVSGGTIRHLLFGGMSHYLINQIYYLENCCQKSKEEVFSMSRMHCAQQLDNETLRYALREYPSRHNIVEFKEVPFSFIEGYAHTEGYRDKLNQLAKDSDVFIIAVDTPYLMEAPDSISRRINGIDIIQEFLSRIILDNDHGLRGKMVMFVPVKCEKWVKDGNIQEVTKKIRSSYHTLIERLNLFNKMNICILPVETIGDVIFLVLSQ